MGRLDGKVALITGAARGQGAAEARLFAAEGACVVVTDILEEDGAAVAAEVEGAYLHHDVSREEEWERIVREALDAHGRIDVLVNNAGIGNLRPIVQTSLEEYRRVVDINQVGVFLGMRAVAPSMMEHGAGSIINISSIAGMRGFNAHSIAYTSSKWAVRGMTKAAAREFGRYGIRVNSIHPGYIDTPMLRGTGLDDEGMDRLIRRVPLGRVGECDDIARTALFLASDDSAYTNGAEFVVDGGLVA